LNVAEQRLVHNYACRERVIVGELRLAGAMTRARATRPDSKRAWHAGIACVVLPRPQVVGEKEPARGEKALGAFPLVGLEMQRLTARPVLR
jgi:hypothetical protein